MFMHVLQVRSLPSRDGQAPAQLVADLITLAPVLEATGGFEITDALDAQIIALFAERIRPEPRRSPTPTAKV